MGEFLMVAEELHSIIVRFQAISLGQKVKVLSALSYNMTVWAREFYPELLENHSEVIKGLRGCNEIQHQISQHIVHLTSGSDECYPDDVLLSILFESAERLGLTQVLHEFFDSLEFDAE